MAVLHSGILPTGLLQSGILNSVFLSIRIVIFRIIMAHPAEIWSLLLLRVGFNELTNEFIRGNSVSFVRCFDEAGNEIWFDRIDYESLIWSNVMKGDVGQSLYALEQEFYERTLTKRWEEKHRKSIGMMEKIKIKIFPSALRSLSRHIIEALKVCEQ